MFEIVVRVAGDVAQALGIGIGITATWWVAAKSYKEYLRRRQGGAP